MKLIIRIVPFDHIQGIHHERHSRSFRLAVLTLLTFTPVLEAETQPLREDPQRRSFVPRDDPNSVQRHGPKSKCWALWKTILESLCPEKKRKAPKLCAKMLPKHKGKTDFRLGTTMAEQNNRKNVWKTCHRIFPFFFVFPVFWSPKTWKTSPSHSGRRRIGPGSAGTSLDASNKATR